MTSEVSCRPCAPSSVGLVTWGVVVGGRDSPSLDLAVHGHVPWTFLGREAPGAPPVAWLRLQPAGHSDLRRELDHPCWEGRGVRVLLWGGLRPGSAMGAVKRQVLVTVACTYMLPGALSSL